jgi:hypothetical protein
MADSFEVMLLAGIDFNVSNWATLAAHWVSLRDSSPKTGTANDF